MDTDDNGVLRAVVDCEDVRHAQDDRFNCRDLHWSLLAFAPMFNTLNESGRADELRLARGLEKLPLDRRGDFAPLELHVPGTFPGTGCCDFSDL